MTTLNHALAQLFKDMAAVYKYLGSGERFRAMAYSRASRVIDNMDDDISTYIKKNRLGDLPGIGESIAEKIREFARTGKVKKFEALKKKVPFELMELMNVSGFGPESLKQVHRELNVSTKEQLITALENGSIRKLKGFGDRKVQNMIRGLKLFKQTEERMLLWDALETGERLIHELKKMKEAGQVELEGSLRRKKETIGDIDILVSCRPRDRKKIVNRFTALSMCKTVLAKGDTRASILIDEDNRQVDLRVVNAGEWGAAQVYFTGSREHNIMLRTIARDRGLKINEYGVFRLKDEKKIAGVTEAEVYAALGFQWVPPEMREDRGELALAAKNKIPKLVQLHQLKGDMQMHSTWSDGILPVEELARHVLKNYKYEYIVLTDHSKSSRIAGGLDEKEFIKQMKEIEAVNKKLGRVFVRKGAEVDILAVGSLDLDDAVLSKMEWVCASIHSGFSKDNTERLIAACRNPYVNCIGHPSGRLIGKREAYPVNWKRVFDAAAETGTAMELNAQPERMDLNDELAKQAREAGVKLVISTDSHAPENFGFMKLGVYMAQRAWCRAGDILNTKGWKELEAFRKKKIRACPV